MCGSKCFSLLLHLIILFKHSCSIDRCPGKGGVQVLPEDFSLENKTFIFLMFTQKEHVPKDLFFGSLRKHNICTNYQLLLEGSSSIKEGYLQVVVKEQEKERKKLKERKLGKERKNVIFFRYNNETLASDCVVINDIGKISYEEGYDLFRLSDGDVLVITKCVSDLFNATQETMGIFIPVQNGTMDMYPNFPELIKQAVLVSNSLRITPRMFPKNNSFERICRPSLSSITLQETVQVMVTILIILGMTTFLFVICKRENLCKCGPWSNRITTLKNNNS